jgi:hypothetical protein
VAGGHRGRPGGRENGFDFDPAAPERLALPRSLAGAIGDHLRVLPPQTRGIVQMLSVLNLRLPLAQLGHVAEIDSPSAAIEPAVASGLVDWWPAEPSCPVAIRHPLVRDACADGRNCGASSGSGASPQRSDEHG